LLQCCLVEVQIEVQPNRGVITCEFVVIASWLERLQTRNLLKQRCQQTLEEQSIVKTRLVRLPVCFLSWTNSALQFAPRPAHSDASSRTLFPRGLAVLTGVIEMFCLCLSLRLEILAGTHRYHQYHVLQLLECST